MWNKTNSLAKTNGSGSTSSEALSQLDNRFIKERRFAIVDWSNVVQTNQSESL